MESAFRGKTMLAAEPTVYICENFACQAPVSGVEAALQAWDELTGQQFPERELLLGEAVAGASISRY
jgi:hypothetical protein